MVSPKPFIVPISGTTNPNHLEENLSAINVVLTEAAIAELENAFLKATVFGNRATKSIAAVHDIGVNIGSSSKGTYGNSPLPKKYT